MVVMVHLMLVLAPVMCIFSVTLVTYRKNLESKDSKTDMKTRKIEDNYQKKSEVKKIIFFTIKFKKANMQLN